MLPVDFLTKRIDCLSISESALMTEYSSRESQEYQLFEETISILRQLANSFPANINRLIWSYRTKYAPDLALTFMQALEPIPRALTTKNSYIPTTIDLNSLKLSEFLPPFCTCLPYGMTTFSNCYNTLADVRLIILGEVHQNYKTRLCNTLLLKTLGVQQVYIENPEEYCQPFAHSVVDFSLISQKIKVNGWDKIDKNLNKEVDELRRLGIIAGVCLETLIAVLTNRIIDSITPEAVLKNVILKSIPEEIARIGVDEEWQRIYSLFHENPQPAIPHFHAELIQLNAAVQHQDSPCDELLIEALYKVSLLIDLFLIVLDKQVENSHQSRQISFVEKITKLAKEHLPFRSCFIAGAAHVMSEHEPRHIEQTLDKGLQQVFNAGFLVIAPNYEMVTDSSGKTPLFSLQSSAQIATLAAEMVDQTSDIYTNFPCFGKFLHNPPTVFSGTRWHNIHIILFNHVLCLMKNRLKQRLKTNF